jgi:ribose transport system substrate-binding protein
MKNIPQNACRRKYAINLLFALSTTFTFIEHSSAQSLVDPKRMEQCFIPKARDTPTVSFAAKKPPYKIAFSNSYFGNNWRDEMLKIADAYVKQREVKQYIKEFKVYNSGQDVSQQIAQIRQIILSGVDALIVNAAQPSGLDQVLEEVAKRGIIIVAFDNTVTSNKAVNINNDQFQMGRRWAEFLAEKTNGKGTILMVHGVAGTPVDNQQSDGAKSVFKKFPDLKIEEVYGNWDVGATQKVVANALAATPQIDAVWGTAACTGTIQGFLQANRPLVPMTGECDNGFMRLVAEKKVPALVIGQPPAMVGVAIRATIALLQGQKLPKEISLPLEEITTEKMVAGQNFFPNLPEGFVTNISVPSCDVKVPIEVFAK